MNYEAVRDAIATLLRGVQGIGQVFRTERFSADPATFLERFATDHPNEPDRMMVNVAWVSRRTSIESADEGLGSRAEDNTPALVEAVEEWELLMFYGFRDDDELLYASETEFQLLLDRVAAAFRWQHRLGIPTVVEYAGPLRILEINIGTFGEILCHRARARLEVHHVINA